MHNSGHGRALRAVEIQRTRRDSGEERRQAEQHHRNLDALEHHAEARLVSEGLALGERQLAVRRARVTAPGARHGERLLLLPVAGEGVCGRRDLGRHGGGTGDEGVCDEQPGEVVEVHGHAEEPHAVGTLQPADEERRRADVGLLCLRGTYGKVGDTGQYESVFWSICYRENCVPFDCEYHGPEDDQSSRRFDSHPPRSDRNSEGIENCKYQSGGKIVRKRDASNGGGEWEHKLRRHGPREKTWGAKVKMVANNASSRLYTTGEHQAGETKEGNSDDSME